MWNDFELEFWSSFFFQVSKKYVSKDLSEQIHKKAEPFLTWLKEAEEESEDEVILILFFDYLKKASELTFKEDSYYFYSESLGEL